MKTEKKSEICISSWIPERLIQSGTDIGRNECGNNREHHPPRLSRKLRIAIRERVWWTGCCMVHSINTDLREGKEARCKSFSEQGKRQLWGSNKRRLTTLLQNIWFRQYLYKMHQPPHIVLNKCNSFHWRVSFIDIIQLSQVVTAHYKKRRIDNLEKEFLRLGNSL